jgi:uncharacterized protein (DUF2235 family)
LLLRAHLYEVRDAYRLYERPDEEVRRELRAALRTLGPAGNGNAEPLPVHMISVWDTVAALGIPKRLQVHPALNTEYHQTDLPRHVTHARHALALNELRKHFRPLMWDGCSRPGQSLQQV